MVKGLTINCMTNSSCTHISAAFSGSPFFEQRAVIALLDDRPRMDSEKRAELGPILFMMSSLSILGEYYGL